MIRAFPADRIKWDKIRHDGAWSIAEGRSSVDKKKYVSDSSDPAVHPDGRASGRGCADPVF